MDFLGDLEGARMFCAADRQLRSVKLEANGGVGVNLRKRFRHILQRCSFCLGEQTVSGGERRRAAVLSGDDRTQQPADVRLTEVYFMTAAACSAIDGRVLLHGDVQCWESAGPYEVGPYRASRNRPPPRVPHREGVVAAGQGIPHPIAVEVGGVGAVLHEIPEGGQHRQPHAAKSGGGGGVALRWLVKPGGRLKALAPRGSGLDAGTVLDALPIPFDLYFGSEVMAQAV